MLNSLTLNTNI